MLDSGPAFQFPIRDMEPETGIPTNPSSTPGAAGGTPQLSPSVVVIIVLITVVFFLSGFLHLLARCFARPNPNNANNLSRRNNSSGSLTSLQGQLQHLFHLHDAGVEQAFIDALPVFLYRAVRGLRDGADCAVCLNEFSGDDRLRLLPKCSHAFHIECIDTWLLSHSTCPLCRCSLVPDTGCSSSTAALMGSSGVRVDSFGASSVATSTSLADSSAEQGDHRLVSIDDPGQLVQPTPQSEPRVVPVKLGRLCPAPVTDQGPEDNSAVINSRRSYSMGSYEYVLDSSSLTGDQVAVVVIAPTPIHRKLVPRGTPGHRAALSECIPEREYSSGGSPWVTIDIDPRPMLRESASRPSFLSWAPWRSKASSKSGSVGEKSFNSDKIKSFSFRLNGDECQSQRYGEEPGGAAAVWWWKNRGSSRCMSEANEPSTNPNSNLHAGGSVPTTGVTWDQASVCSTNAEMKSTGSAASSMTTVSIARRTLQWLMGRDKHHHRSSTEDQAVH